MTWRKLPSSTRVEASARGRKRLSKRESMKLLSTPTKSQTALFEMHCGSVRMLRKDKQTMATWVEHAREEGEPGADELTVETLGRALASIGFPVTETAVSTIWTEVCELSDVGDGGASKGVGALAVVDAYKAAGWSHHYDPFGGTEYFHNEATGETVWGDLGSGGMKDIGYRQRTRRLSHELSDDQAPLSPRSAGSALDTLPESIYDNRPADDFSRASAWRSIDTAPSPTGSYGSPPSLAKVVVRAVPTPPRPSMPCIIAEGWTDSKRSISPAEPTKQVRTTRKKTRAC